VALRAVELDLAARGSLASTVICPAWFMEDFSETFLQPVNGEIVVPAGDGDEAFVSVEDIAAVAYAQVLRPLTATLASGNGARPNSDVLDVTGTAPVTFAEFAAKTAPAWK
jgi:uncharacterized protein YbjT (DUF2867 family)